MSDAVFRAILDLNSFEGSSQADWTAFPERIPSSPICSALVKRV